MRIGVRIAAAVLVGTLLPAAGQAAELRIGLQTETSSLDPHFALVGANQQVARHLFDSLLGSDAAMRPVAGLAESWTVRDGTLWEFRLRRGVTFHDGSPFTAEDVRFSLDRMPRVPGSPAPFVRLAGIVAEVIVPDPYTIQLRTRAYDSALPLHAMSAWVVSHRAAEGATTADFNAGRAAIGTGPWRLEGWARGERLTLARNDGHWGTRPAFERAILRPISNDAGRVAALMAGDVQMIDNVPPAEIGRLRARQDVRIWSAGSARMIYLGLEQERDLAPGTSGRDGQPLARNPFKDRRVRLAMSHAINRALIVERILQGAGRPAGQLVPAGLIGHDPALEPHPFDPDLARRLLAEAGFAQGFRATLYSPNNRYVEDDKTAQAAAQMLTRIGIEVRVEVMPANVFFTRAGRREFGFFLIGFGTTAGDSFTGLSQVLHSFDQPRRLGALNRGRFASPAFDAVIAQAQGEQNALLRETLLQRAARVGFFDEVGVIPLHFADNVWATRQGIQYRATTEESTLAHHARPE